jgi:hypothetical protein
MGVRDSQGTLCGFHEPTKMIKYDACVHFSKNAIHRFFSDSHCFLKLITHPLLQKLRDVAPEVFCVF